MSLDQNLFTLFLTPNTSQPAGTVIDLTDPSGAIHYRRRRILSEQQLYRIEVFDPFSEALLASATAPSATSKHKTLELYNPSKVVELKYTGTLTFRWSFKWEIHEFEWKREECFIIRKPDPPVLVAVTKEPPGRIRTASVQILDYNLNRFDIEDRKGLEIVILTALLTFQDASDAYHEPNATSLTSQTGSASAPSPAAETTAPKLPPKPAPKKGVARIAELQLGRGQVNEVTVLEEGTAVDYAKHCTQLLKDGAMLFISVRSSDPNQVPKVLQVVEEIKRLRHKAGDPDLHSYVLYDTNEGIVPQKGPRIINLDDNNGKGKNKQYTAPKSVTVHLSKIDMPELRPRGTPLDSPNKDRHERDGGKRKDKGRSNGAKGKDKAEAKDKDKRKESSGRTKPNTAPASRHSTSPPRAVLKHKHRSQFLGPSTLSPTGPGPSSRISIPWPRPPYAPPPPQYPLGTVRRQSMYGSLNGGHYYHDYAIYRREGMAPIPATLPANDGSTPGLLGRFRTWGL